MKCLALAMLMGALMAECANACCPGGMSTPSMPSTAPPSHTPPPSSVSPPFSVPGVGAVNSAVRDAVEFGSVKAKVRAKNPNATEEQVEAGTKKVIKARRQREQEDQQALIESKKRQNLFEEERQLREESKLRQEIFEKQLEEMRTAKERNTRRDSDRLAGPLPTFVGRDDDHSQPRHVFDTVVVAPGFIWSRQSRPLPPPPL